MSEPPHITRSTDEHAVGRPVPRYSARARRRDDDATRSPHSHRFRTATAVLAGVAVAAVVVAVAVVIAGNNSRTTSPQAWSSWSPPDSGTLGATEIAAHVAPFYRLSAVDQLDVVTVVNLESAAAASAQAQAEANGTGVPPSSGLQVAVRPNPQSSAVSLLSGNTIAYNLCGLGGKDCAISVGTPSTNRLLLLRREALELALYTFKYLSGVENVVAILPPGRTETTSTLTKSLPTSDSPTTGKPINLAVLFVRQELAPLLKQPLSATLPEQYPPTVDQMANAPEAGLVEQITGRGLFSEQLQTAQDGSDLIVLDPLPPQ
jgi:hypothetical protein